MDISKHKADYIAFNLFFAPFVVMNEMRRMMEQVLDEGNADHEALSLTPFCYDANRGFTFPTYTIDSVARLMAQQQEDEHHF